MRVLLASPRGYCAGVNMAIETLEVALERFGTPLYVFHEIVHNRWVVEDFTRRGVVFVNDLDDVPVGGRVLYSAHGVSPGVRRQAKQRQLYTIDATCPLVTKVHREAVRFAEEGYTIILVGHAGHDEVIGTMGEAPEAIHLVGDAADVDRLELARDSKVAYLTQTTLSVEDAERIISRLRQRYPHIAGPRRNDICYATQNRQEAVRHLTREADLFLVVGSHNSSNSRRLAEIAAEAGTPSLLVDGPDDLAEDHFAEDQTVAITAGASAPEHLVQGCIAWLQERYAVEVEAFVLRDESVQFPLPAELRSGDTM